MRDEAFNHQPDADELVWTCSIVEATFHNGDPMTADDVKYSYDLAISENCTYNPSICRPASSSPPR